MFPAQRAGLGRGPCAASSPREDAAQLEGQSPLRLGPQLSLRGQGSPLPLTVATGAHLYDGSISRPPPAPLGRAAASLAARPPARGHTRARPRPSDSERALRRPSSGFRQHHDVQRRTLRGAPPRRPWPRPRFSPRRSESPMPRREGPGVPLPRRVPPALRRCRAGRAPPACPRIAPPAPPARTSRLQLCDHSSSSPPLTSTTRRCSSSASSASPPRLAATIHRPRSPPPLAAPARRPRSPHAPARRPRTPYRPC